MTGIAERKPKFRCELRRLRLDRAMSQSDLANKTGVQRVTIIAAERGRGIQLETGIAIAEFLGVPVQEIWKRIPKKRFSQ